MTGRSTTFNLPPPCLLDGDPAAGFLILCDHASNALPPIYGTLGLPAAELERHIAYDIGAATVARTLAARLRAPAVLAPYSRLLIDPNRGLDDPTLIMKLSDSAVVPGNAGIDAAERALRIERYYRPTMTPSPRPSRARWHEAGRPTSSPSTASPRSGN
jgi:predicted N-formylglutamate amidohydrolase